MADTDLQAPPPGFGPVRSIGTSAQSQLQVPPPGFGPVRSVAVPHGTASAPAISGVGKTLRAWVPGAELLPDGSSQSPGETTLPGLTGSFTRGLAPVAAGAGIGALIGAPSGPGAILGAGAGAGAAALTELATSIYNPLAKHFGWPESATPQEMTDRVLDVIGEKRPTTGLERTAEAIGGGVSGAGAEANAAKLVAEKAITPTVKAVAAQLGEKPVLQTISGATGGAAAQAAAEAGLGPVGQQIAGLIGGATPYGKQATTSLPRSAVRPEARAMIENGYVLPPTEIPPLGEKPSETSKLLGAESGKLKLQQDSSTKNQINTNNLAAEEIGLHPEITLTEQAFEEARQPAAGVYREVEQAVPEVTLADDKTYRSAASRIGAGKSLVEKFFPRTKDNPAIAELRKDLLQNPAVPTPVAMQMIADLRHQAGINFRAVGDVQKHALGLAQREAADVMEDAVDRSIQNSPMYYAKKFESALSERRAADQEMTRINMNLTKAAADLSTNSNVYTVSRAMRAGRDAEKNLAKAQERYNQATETVENWRTKLRTAYEQDDQNRSLIDRYRDARKLFAKIYNIEDATNRTTGNVSAAGLARIYNKGAPLTGRLKTIADAYNTAPKSMQVPENFGRSEDWSAGDFFGTALSVAMGHPAAGGMILARPGARTLLTSRPYQSAIIAPPATSTPLALALNPGAAAVQPVPPPSPFGM